MVFKVLEVFKTTLQQYVEGKDRKQKHEQKQSGNAKQRHMKRTALESAATNKKALMMNFSAKQ